MAMQAEPFPGQPSRERRPSTILIIVLVLTTACCVEWLERLNSSQVGILVSYFAAALIPLHVASVFSTCWDLEPRAVHISLLCISFTMYLLCIFRAMSCSSFSSAWPAILSYIRPSNFGFPKPFYLIPLSFGISEVAVYFMVIEEYFHVKAMVSFAVSGLMLLLSLFNGTVASGLSCSLLSSGYLMTCCLPALLEVIDHAYPVLKTNPLAHVWRWMAETVIVYVRKRRHTSSPSFPASATHSPSTSPPSDFAMRTYVSVNYLEELAADGGLRTPPRKRLGTPTFTTMPRGALDRKTLVLDLDETLVHSSSRPQRRRADLQFNVEINSTPCTFFVLKRPFVDWFLRQVTQWYDVVIFTASLRKYADPVIDMLAVNGTISNRLFRDACLLQQGAFLKDLHTVSRDLSAVLIVDNSPGAYALQKENAIPIEGWYDNPRDKALLQLLPLLHLLRDCTDVRQVLSRYVVHVQYEAQL